MAEPYYIYVLLSETFQKTYTGCTANIEKRVLEHNRGSNNYSRKFRPWKIIYTEKFDSKEQALQREKYLKTHAGRKFLKKILNNPR